MEWITTSTILDRLSDYGNEAAWNRFVTRFRRPIVSFARRMGLSEADAEDAAQEALAAFAESYRGGRYDRSKGRLSHWLFGIAFHVAQAKRRSVIRHAAVSPQDGSFAWQTVAAEEEVTRLWDEEWEKSLLHTCLDRVRQEVEPATMDAFVLVMRGGRTPAEAAAELGVPVKTVYNAKYSVLKRLRSCRRELEATL